MDVGQRNHVRGMAVVHCPAEEHPSKYVEVHQDSTHPGAARVVEDHQIATWGLLARRNCAVVGHCCVFHHKHSHLMAFGQKIEVESATDPLAVLGSQNLDTTWVAGGATGVPEAVTNCRVD